MASLKDDRKSLEIIPERAKVVKEIFDLTSQGMGRQAIANRLNACGDPVRNKLRKVKPGWHPSSTQIILTNPAVIGRFQPHCKGEDGERTPAGDEIVDYFPAIIDEASYYSVQAKRQPRGRYGSRKRVNRKNSLKSLIINSG